MGSAHNSFPLAPRVLNISLTERCTAACAMCVTESHPGRTGTDVTEPDLLAWLESARSIPGPAAVCAVGGEPFLMPGALELLVRWARGRGWQASVVTNCFWATSLDEAERVLGRLRAAGLTRITVSTDGFHARFVPLERVDHAVAAAGRVGLQANLNCVAAGGFGLRWLRRRLHSFSVLDQVEEFPCLPVGRGRALTALEREVPHGRCGLIVSTLSIRPQGHVYACCGVGGFTAPLYLGHASTPLMDLIERALADPLVLALAIHGPRFIAELAGVSAVGVDGCHLCYRLLSDPARAAEVRSRLSSSDLRLRLSVEHAVLSGWALRRAGAGKAT